MTISRRTAAFVLALAILFNCAPLGRACGPESLVPVFVFDESPDPPFEEFTRGRLGIVQPTMGRKTLFISYRYLNGGSFTGEEQRALIEALNGKAPEDKGEIAIRTWIEARKAAGLKDEALPSIYSERQYGGYDFFPNCTKSGFETATETLKDRIASNGAEDPHVRLWMTAQDTVFQNCAGGSSVPQELGPDNPEWIRKDRDYQIAAAYFYSLSFNEARDRFERIAADNESPWRQTADYLVARTLVRQASLTSDQTVKRQIYEHAERHLQLLIGSGGKFLNASQKLLALINYRIRPEERVGELGGILAYRNGNENLRQDLIDYVWLLDKFDAQVMKEEDKRKEALKSDEDKTKDVYAPDSERMATYEAINRGELIDISYTSKKTNGDSGYEKYVVVIVQPDASEAEILELITKDLGRKLSSEEINEIKERHKTALEHRLWRLAPNRSLSKVTESQYEGYYSYAEEKPALNLYPAFLRNNELSDWILTFQNTDPVAYAYAITKWRETDSIAWLLAALAKAERTSPQLEKLLSQAEKTPSDSAAYTTIAYHLIRLKIMLGRHSEARKLFEEVLSTQSDLLPVSAHNQFLELGMQLATNMREFLSFGQRKPAAFYEFGKYGTISDILKIQKSFWNPEWTKQTKEEFEEKVDESFKDLLTFEDRLAFDQKTVDVFNTHFPLAALADAGRDPALPGYLQEQVLLAAWTRAILLKNEKTARKVAAEISELTPNLKTIFTAYLDARSVEERDRAALFILLRSPGLSPFVAGGVPLFLSAEESSYYFDTSWWCTPSETEYDMTGNEVMKVVAKPRFLSPEQLETARKEHQLLVSIGNAKAYLGNRAIAWAKRARNDIRVPEALFIAFKANQNYKYGCGGWEVDEKLQQEASAILRSRYPDSPWTARLSQPDN